jgi:hypothetical protein
MLTSSPAARRRDRAPMPRPLEHRDGRPPRNAPQREA